MIWCRKLIFNCWYGTLSHSEIQFKMIKLLNLLLYFSFGKKIPLTGSGGIRTHVIKMTGTWNQRLRPLGHTTTHVFSLNCAEAPPGIMRNLIKQKQFFQTVIRVFKSSWQRWDSNPRHRNDWLLSQHLRPIRQTTTLHKCCRLMKSDIRQLNNCNIKTKCFVDRESNPDLLLGRQQC